MSGVGAYSDSVPPLPPRRRPFAMDTLVDSVEDPIILSYDDPTPIDSDPSTAAETGDSAGRSLADRISSTKVYLLSDASKPRVGKVRNSNTHAPTRDLIAGIPSSLLFYSFVPSLSCGAASTRRR